MNWKLVLGIFFLFTGFLSIVGIGLILLYMLDEYKIISNKKRVTVEETKEETKEEIIDTYISPSVIEEFR